jgi:hypothetical protein
MRITQEEKKIGALTDGLQKLSECSTAAPPVAQINREQLIPTTNQQNNSKKQQRRNIPNEH